jgi:hypothetical protein
MPVLRGEYDEEVAIRAYPFRVVMRRGEWLVVKGETVIKNHGSGSKGKVKAIAHFSSLMMVEAKKGN